jgi:hypothetical protein
MGLDQVGSILLHKHQIRAKRICRRAPKARAEAIVPELGTSQTHEHGSLPAAGIVGVRWGMLQEKSIEST